MFSSSTTTPHQHYTTVITVLSQTSSPMIHQRRGVFCVLEAVDDVDVGEGGEKALEFVRER